MKNIGFILLIVLISGCASNKPPAGPVYTGPIEQKENMATVYIFRGLAFAGSLRDVNVFINGSAEHVLSNGSYIATYLSPGEYEFGIKNVPGWQYKEGPYIHLKYSIEPGNSYYVGYFKAFDVAGTPEEEFFQKSSKQEINTGLLEVGLLDIDHILGVIKEEHALRELEKLKLSRMVVNPEKI